jgi:hypothetical protein
MPRHRENLDYSYGPLAQALTPLDATERYKFLVNTLGIDRQLMKTIGFNDNPEDIARRLFDKIHDFNQERKILQVVEEYERGRREKTPSQE